MIKDENRKGAAKPRPLCTPLGLFLECLTVAGGRVLTCACMLRLFRVERCADGAPWALWMCDVLAEAGAFANAAPSLLGWLWCVLRLRGIRGRVCGRRAWFAGMIVVCVAFRGL